MKFYNDKDGMINQKAKKKKFEVSFRILDDLSRDDQKHEITWWA